MHQIIKSLNAHTHVTCHLSLVSLVVTVSVHGRAGAGAVAAAPRSRRAADQRLRGHEQHAELPRERVARVRAQERHDLLLQLPHHRRQVLAGHGVRRVQVHYGFFEISVLKIGIL